MQCSEFEIRLCDYLDGTLDEAARREAQQHASECRLCGALLADSSAALAFLERAPAAEAPPELATRILYRTQAAHQSLWSAAAGWRRWFQPLLQPRFVMGMAMTILSLSMLSRIAGVKFQQLEAADLNPVSVWRNIENQGHRIWSRGVKFYQNVRFVYEIMGQLRALEAAEGQAEEEVREEETGSDSTGGNAPSRPGRPSVEPSPAPDRGP